MSKNLIINKLNKCNAYEYNKDQKLHEDSTSKLSTSTKTQQSPTLFSLNPEFTFKATNLKEVFLPRPQAKQFFQNFNPTHQVIYQKVILTKCKVLERSLEFELMNLALERQQSHDNFVGRKLQFNQNQSPTFPTFPTIPVMESIEFRQTPYRIPEYIKTEYNQQTYREPKTLQSQQNQYREYYQNIPYDSKKYKLSRQKIGPLKNSNTVFNPQKRCQTESNQAYLYEPFQPTNLTTYQSQQNGRDEFDDYHFVTQDIKEGQREPYCEFNNYYLNGNVNVPKCEDANTVEKRDGDCRGILLSKRSGNSSRLSFFRKQREQHFRKSLLEEFNRNNSKRTNICSNQNKENIKSNIKFVPTLAFNNLSKAAQKKLKNQYSERFLLGRRHLQEPLQSGKPTLSSKGSVNCMSKETQTRIMSIRKQLRDIYQFQDKEKCKLKIMRDQETYENNARNSLRRVGSICKF